MFIDDAVPNNASSAVIVQDNTGVIPSGLKFSPAELYFGALVVGEDQLTREFEVKNIGRKTIRIDSVILTGGEQFTMNGEWPEIIKSGESFTLSVTYLSSAPGLFTGYIEITTNEDRDPYHIGMSGRVIGSLQIEATFGQFTALVEQEAWARANADGAEAGQRLLLQATMGEDIEAAITQERIARVTAQEAIATNVETMSARLGDAEGLISEESTVRATQDQVIIDRLVNLEAGVSTTDSVARASIVEESIARADGDEAEALQRTILAASLRFETGEAVAMLSASISEETQARVTALGAEAELRETLGASMTTYTDTKVSAAVNTVTQAYVDADEALSSLVQNLGADLTNLDGTVQGHSNAITSIQTSVEDVGGLIEAEATRIDSLSVRATGGTNEIENSEFATDTVGWSVAYNTSTPVVMSKGNNANYAVAPSGSLLLFQTGNQTNKDLHGVAIYGPIPVIAGRRYQCSVFSASQRARLSIHIAWFDIAGNALSNSLLAYNNEEALGGKSLAEFKRIGVFGIAPAGATFAQVHLRKYTASGANADSAGFFVRPQFCEATQTQTEFSPYVQGSSRASLAASVTVTANAVAAVDGKLSASYGFAVTAGGRIASMKALATGTTSSINFLADSIGFSINDVDTPKKVVTVGLRNGTPAVVLNGDLYADGSINANALNIGVGGNLLSRASLINGTEGWGYYDGIGGGECAADSSLAGPDWQPSGGHSIGMKNPGGGANAVALLASEQMSCTAGQRYEWSVYSGAHRCRVYMTIHFLDAGGSQITEFASSANNEEALGGRGLSGYKRIFGFAIAPAGSVSMAVQLRKEWTKPGQTSSFAFFTQPFLAEAGTSQTVPSRWAAGGLGVKITAAGIVTPNISSLSANLGYVTAGEINMLAASMVRSNSKYWADGSSNFIMARGSDGSNYLDFQYGTNRFWMSSWGDCGIIFPGFSVIGGVLTINQLNVINTSNIVTNAVTVPVAAYTAANLVSTTPTNVQQVTLDIGPYGASSGVMIRANVFLNFTNTGTWSLYRDGTLLMTETYTSTSLQIVVDYVDYPGAGSHTYYFQVNGLASGSVAASRRSLSALGCKR